MKILVVLILLAFGLATEVKTQRLNDAKTQSEDSASLCLCDSASYYESQIRKADSLYKNYLPQYNFEEVKVAMEFFDSLNSCQSSAVSRHQSKFSKLHGLKPNLIDTLTYRLINFNCAKAHYYHAVGLTEKDDVVGACEHYLIALEIMEDMMAKDKSLRKKDKRLKTKGKGLCDSASLRLCDSNKEDYEKIRFVALIHTRLGELFLNETCCDLSLVNYKKALYYSNIIENNLSVARTLKYIGYSYQLLNDADSALYFYNKSLRISDNIDNELDIYKCVAQIMYFYKGERDSAYFLLKNNLDVIHNENVKYSYHYTLGNIFYNDKSYDSALYYLESSLDKNIISQKLAFTTTLSAIYDSLGNYEKKAYYDNISLKLFVDNINKEVDKSKLQMVYEDYKELKNKKAIAESKKKTIKTIAIVIACVSIAFILLLVYIRYKHRKHSNWLRKEIDDNNYVINEIEQIIEDYHKSNVWKDDIIKKQKKELDKIKHKSDVLDKKTKLDRFYKSEICEKILRRKGLELVPLIENELHLLIMTANHSLDNLIIRLFEEFPKLTTTDMHCICLLVLLNNNSKIAYMLGRNRKTIWERINRIKNIMGLDVKCDLFLHIIENYI